MVEGRVAPQCRGVARRAGCWVSELCVVRVGWGLIVVQVATRTIGGQSCIHARRGVAGGAGTICVCAGEWETGWVLEDCSLPLRCRVTLRAVG